MAEHSRDPHDSPPDPEVLQHAIETGHETRDAHMTAILVSGLALFGLMVFSLIFVYWLSQRWLGDTSELAETYSSAASSTERVDFNANQSALRRQMEAEQQARLDRFGWVDRQRGIAHIPIETAIHLLAESGEFELPEETASPAPATSTTTAETEGATNE